MRNNQKDVADPAEARRARRDFRDDFDRWCLFRAVIGQRIHFFVLHLGEKELSAFEARGLEVTKVRSDGAARALAYTRSHRKQSD